MIARRTLPAIAALVLAQAFTAAAPADAGVRQMHAPAPSPVPAAADLDAQRSKRLYLDIIHRLRDDGKSHAALAYLDDFDKRYPGDAQAQLLRADCLLAVGRPAQAAALYNALVDGDYRADAQAGLGNVAAQSGNWAAAVNAYRAAVAADPVRAALRNDLGYALLKYGQRDDALFVLRQARELAPGDARIRNNLLLALEATGHGDEAAQVVAAIGDDGERAAATQLLASWGAGR